MHIVMFPWLAFGHIIPFLDLSKFIAKKGHKVSFISTPRNIDRLPKLPPNLNSSITFVKIPLPKIAELPENAEATTDIRNEEDMPFLKRAFDGLENELTRYLEEAIPDWIIYDFAPYWLPPIAVRLGISRASFSIVNAWFLVFAGPIDPMINCSDYRTKLEDFMVPPKWVNFETNVAYRLFEAKWMFGSGNNNASGVSDFYRFGTTILGSEVVLIRYCHEFEPDWLKLLEEIYHKPVIPLGLMPPIVQDNNSSTGFSVVVDDDGNWISMKKWLDEQKKGSVVYVALGSELTLSQSQLTELALGLESSGVLFFWALKKTPQLSHELNSIELPDGFKERVEGRGIVWRSWAPQLKILGHDSIGGFLTHCGWSSIVEGLMFGRPLITLPFLVDQGLNSRVVANKLVGIEIPRNESDGSYTRNSVADSIKLVMDENCGKQFRDNAKEMSTIFRNKELHDLYLEKFMEFIEYHRNMSFNQ